MYFLKEAHINSFFQRHDCETFCYLFYSFIFIVYAITVPAFSPFPHLHQPYPLSSPCQSLYHCQCPWIAHKHSLVSPFTIWHPVSTPPTDTVSLFYVFVLLFLFCSLVYYVLQIPHISEIMWYLSFTDWLISLSIFSRSIHAVVGGKNFFFFIAAQYSIVQMYHSFFYPLIS